MTQLVLDGVELPESRKGGYTAAKTPLSDEVEMVTGRLVREVRGSVWLISYQYGFFDDVKKNSVIAVCERGRRTPILCRFLPPSSSGSLSTSSFWVTSFTYPKFMWSTEGKPLWADFSLSLREVRPSD